MTMNTTKPPSTSVKLCDPGDVTVPVPLRMIPRRSLLRFLFEALFIATPIPVIVAVGALDPYYAKALVGTYLSVWIFVFCRYSGRLNRISSIAARGNKGSFMFAIYAAKLGEDGKYHEEFRVSTRSDLTDGKINLGMVAVEGVADTIRESGPILGVITGINLSEFVRMPVMGSEEAVSIGTPVELWFTRFRDENRKTVDIVVCVGGHDEDGRPPRLMELMMFRVGRSMGYTDGVREVEAREDGE